MEDLWGMEHDIARIEQDVSVIIYIKSLHHTTIDSLKNAHGYERAQICRIFEKTVTEADRRIHEECFSDLITTLYEIGPANDKQEILDWLDQALDPINKCLNRLENEYQQLKGN